MRHLRTFPGASRAIGRLLLKAALHGALAAAFWYAFYVRYWQWRECIAQAASSCTAPGAWNATEGGMIWALPAAIFSLLALKAVVFAAILARKRSRDGVDAVVDHESRRAADHKQQEPW